MPRFLFNLDGVLRQRKLVEDQRQREFAAVQARYAAMEATLRGMDDEVRTATEDLRTKHLIGRINLDYLAAHRRFTIAVQRKALAYAQEMAAVRQQLDAARAALVESAKERKILEKLRERRQSEWAADQSRRESAAIDEIAQQIGTRMVRSATAEGEAAAARFADSAGEDAT